MQEVEIEMVGAEAFEARLASARDAVSRHVVGPHFGHEENAIALAGDRTTNEFLGAVNFRRVDHRHSERKARAQRFFFIGLRAFSLSKTRGALAQGRDDRSVAKLHRAPFSG